MVSLTTEQHDKEAARAQRSDNGCQYQTRTAWLHGSPPCAADAADGKSKKPNQDPEASGKENVTSCSVCLAYEFSLCAAMKQLGDELEPDDAPVACSVHTIPSRRTICHAKEWSEFVTVICKGWAASSSALPDGRRQIHSILLPGDVVLSTGPFNPVFGHTVEAITDVTYRRYKRSELERVGL